MFKRKCPSNVRNRADLTAILDVAEGEHPRPVSAPLRRDFESPLEKKETVEKSEVVENAEPVEKYSVVWGKPSSRKRKKWEGDGVLEVRKAGTRLYDEEGRLLSSGNRPLGASPLGQIFMIGSKEVEIIESLTSETLHQPTPTTNAPPERSLPREKSKPTSFSNFVSPQTATGKFEPLVLPPPPDEHQWERNSERRPPNVVAVDAFLTARLRPHQREGVEFLYKCVMGFERRHAGAILADEMGLGKTLQCIALLWTLLKCGPYGRPVIRKALIVTPSTLRDQWRKEILKWLGRERLTPYVVDDSNRPSGFSKSSKESVMIVSYERFAKYFDDIEGVGFDLVICDEAHRLKNANIKSARALTKLNCEKKILLTGTPLQNHLREYFVLIDICNPGILGTYPEFKESYEDPILKSQHPSATSEEKLLGKECAHRLQSLTSNFVLRRTQNLLKDFLPTKAEYVICCRMTDSQPELYSSAIETWWNEYESQPCSPLTLINVLKKICNHPNLVNDDRENGEIMDKIKYTSSADGELADRSGKFKVMCGLIESCLWKKEKIVIVSSSTRMLDIIAQFLNEKSIGFARLDGKTPMTHRQRIVDEYNAKYGPPIFLLSSHAGGVGLSLPAASTLILYDSDWNPAVDKQAMARIWRDGQKRNVSLYRLLTAGSIEEKIYQRQMYKTGISDTISDPDNAKSILKMCTDKLRDLFNLNIESECITHDLLNCNCSGEGDNEVNENDQENIESVEGHLGHSVKDEENDLSINQLKLWLHFKSDGVKCLLETLDLMSVQDYVTFIFMKKY